MQGSMKANKVVSLTISCLLTLSLISCKTKEPETGKVFRSAIESDVPALDSINVGDTTSHDVAYNIYNGLVTYRPEITGPNQKLIDIVPDLSESWVVSPDGKTYTFKLKKGVKFHDNTCFKDGKGREVKASDFKYCFDRICVGAPDNQMYWLFKDKVKGANEYYESTKRGTSARNFIAPHFVPTFLKSIDSFCNDVS